MPTDLYSGGEYADLIAHRRRLEADLAQDLGAEPSRVFLSSGSLGALRSIIGLLAGPRSASPDRPRCVLDLPNYFDTLRFLACADYQVLGVPRVKLEAYPLDGMLEALQSRPNLLVLTTPNNPLGQSIPDASLCRLLDALPEGCVGLVDRTCLNVADEVSTRDLLQRYEGRDVVVLHSFSKSHGCSAVRIGYYVCTSTALADRLRRHDDPGQVSLLAMQELRERLRDEELPRRRKRDLQESLALLRGFSKERPWFQLEPSTSNFCMVTLPHSLTENLRRTYRFPDASAFGVDLDGMCRLPLDDPGKIRCFLEDCSRGMS
jgi:histidinol-phosphate/aromatic aminotransferase/cobyric acid decarboxylase-like protein